MSETIEAPPADAAPVTDTLEAIYDRAVSAEVGIGHNGGPELPAEPARAPDGKFAAKDAPAEPEAAGEPEAPPVADDAPKLPPGMALNVELLNPTARAAFLADIKEGRLHLAPLPAPAPPPDPVRLVADEYKPSYAAKGLTEEGAVRALFEAQKFIEQDPVNGAIWLAEQAGVLDQLAARLGVRAPQGQPLAPDPVIAELRAEVAQLKQWRGTADAEREQIAMAEVNARVADFANGKEFFEMVRADMAPMVSAGMTLEKAYKAACAANDTVQARIAQAQEAKQRSDAAARSAQARRGAGFNIPATNGASAPRPSLEQSAGDVFDRYAGLS